MYKCLCLRTFLKTFASGVPGLVSPEPNVVRPGFSDLLPKRQGWHRARWHFSNRVSGF